MHFISKKKIFTSGAAKEPLCGKEEGREVAKFYCIGIKPI